MLDNCHECRIQKLQQEKVALEAKLKELATQNTALIQKTNCIQKSEFSYEGSGWIRLALIRQGMALLCINTGGGSHGYSALLQLGSINGYAYIIHQLGGGIFANENVYTKARLVRKNASEAYIDIYKTKDVGAKSFRLQSFGEGIQLYNSGNIITSIGEGYTAKEIDLSNTVS